MEPPREDGRRCLDAGEMRELGWRLNTRGRWIHPARAVRTAQIESANRKEAVPPIEAALQ